MFLLNLAIDSEGAAEEDDPIDPDAVPQPDVSIPGVALGEAAKRCVIALIYLDL